MFTLTCKPTYITVLNFTVILFRYLYSQMKMEILSMESDLIINKKLDIAYCILTYPFIYLLTYLFTYFLSFLLTYLLTYLLIY